MISTVRRRQEATVSYTEQGVGLSNYFTDTPFKTGGEGRDYTMSGAHGFNLWYPIWSSRLQSAIPEYRFETITGCAQKQKPQN